MNKLKKEEFEYLVNDKDYMKKIIAKSVYQSEVDSFWNTRAILLINTIIDSIFELKNIINEKITIKYFREFMRIDNLIKLKIFLKDNKLNHNELEIFLNSLPTYKEGEELSNRLLEQYGYLTMQFSESISVLFDFYHKNEELPSLEKIIITNKINHF